MPTEEGSLSRIEDTALVGDSVLRRRAVRRDVALVRRTARCLAGLILSGMFDDPGHQGRAANETLRQWLLQLVE